jgi:hypothetical protein
LVRAIGHNHGYARPIELLASLSADLEALFTVDSVRALVVLHVSIGPEHAVQGRTAILRVLLGKLLELAAQGDIIAAL